MIASLLAPLMIGLVVHGVCIRTGTLASLASAVDRGAQWRGRPLIDANKTWRGIVTVALGTAAGFPASALLGISRPRLGPTWSRVLVSIGIFALCHQAISIVGYFPGMRTSAR